MRILRLDLLAFGPFTDTRLDLEAGEQGLHIVYGPNEAGKSSALRGLRQMLYGIEERSPDDFVHPYARLRLAGVLRHSDESLLAFTRRKGRVNTLREADDETPLEPSRLARFLGGVNAEVFSSMFGLDHGELVRGGRDLVQGGGSLGQILFAAGAGLSRLRRVQEKLRAEADELFRPAGKKQAINQTLAQLRAVRKELREAQLPDQEWSRHDRALREALERKALVDADLAARDQERRRLLRIADALPLIARRAERLEELATLSDTAVLPEDFGERRLDLLTHLRVAEAGRARCLENLAALKGQRAALEVPEALLESEEAIERNHRDLGSHLKASGDLTKLVTRRDILLAAAGGILAGLRQDLALEEAGRLRLKRAERARIEDLAGQFDRLVTRIEGGRDEIARLSPRIRALEEEITGLAVPRPVDALRGVIEDAQKQGALEGHCGAELADIRRAQAGLEAALRRQTLWPGTLEGLPALALPLTETLDVFEERLTRARDGLARLQQEEREAEEGLLKIDGEIEKLRLEREVPTEKDLEEARRSRDKGWRLLRRVWEEGREPDEEAKVFVAAFPGAASLAEAYEAAVRRGDELADRLRREAEGVAKRAALLAERDRRQDRRGRLQAEVEAAGVALADVEASWAELWSATGISPRTPREMRAWVQDLKHLAEEVCKLEERRSKAEDLKARLRAQREALGACLSGLGEPPDRAGETLSDLISRGRALVEQEEGLRRTREQLLGELKKRRGELEETTSRVAGLEGDLARWREDWEGALRPLGLGRKALPAEARAVLEDLDELFTKLEETGELGRRIRGIERDAGEFTGRVTALVARVARDLAALPAEQAAAELNARLTQARLARSRREELDRQRRAEEEKLAGFERDSTEIASRLATMCGEARCAGPEGLAAAEKRSARRRALESDLELIEGELRERSGGATVEAFVREARGVDPDSVHARAEGLGEEIERLRLERSELDQAIGTERNELRRMDGGSGAADLAEEAQMLLGRLEAEIEKYARLRLASAVLVQAVERYREAHQGPVLGRANELFARLTLGSFAGVRAEFDGQGRPVLVGVRPGGRELVGLAGMSDGSADQLYLALRLASLEEYLTRNEPLPLVVDDILIRFDNERAAAALEVLAELSARTQVIFFTHHRHLLDLAEAAVPPGVLFRHALNEGRGTSDETER